MGKQDSPQQEQPDTYRETQKRFLESELEQIYLSPSKLVEMLAGVLAERENPCAEPDFDAGLIPTAEMIWSGLGLLRWERVENDAPTILRNAAVLSEADARAVKAGDSHDGFDIGGSFTRTNKGGAERPAELASARLSRQQGTAEAAQPVARMLSEDDPLAIVPRALLRGTT